MTHRRLDDLSLREKKKAQTQLNLVMALMDELQTRTVDQISTSELARTAGVSPATFFNYFPAKADLLTFFIQVWAIDMGIRSRQIEADTDSALAALEGVFAETARLTALNPSLMLEIIAHQARMPVDHEPPGVSEAVRLLRFPDVPDVAELPAGGLQDIVPRLLERAVRQGELPDKTDQMALSMGVFSVFFGVPLLVARRQPAAVEPMYVAQLRLLWAGARAGGA